jgi:hypothetical protein
MDELVSRITPILKVLVIANVARYAVHQDGLGPRNIIEEFDPGSA